MELNERSGGLPADEVAHLLRRSMQRALFLRNPCRAVKVEERSLGGCTAEKRAPFCRWDASPPYRPYPDIAHSTILHASTELPFSGEEESSPATANLRKAAGSVRDSRASGALPAVTTALARRRCFPFSSASLWSSDRRSIRGLILRIPDRHLRTGRSRGRDCPSRKPDCGGVDPHGGRSGATRLAYTPFPVLAVLAAAYAPAGQD